MSWARALVLIASAALAAGTEPPPDAVQVKTRLSQTAVWPGDRVGYTLEIACAPNVDVVTDDLLPDKLVLSGLEVLSADRERSVAASGAITYRVRYQLTTYEVAAPLLRIGEQVVRYSTRRPGQRPEDAAPAGEARVPASTLALRSTLPEALSASGLLDSREAAALPRALVYARPVGLGLLLVSAAPVALWVAGLAREVRAARRARRARQRQSATTTRGVLEELRAVDASSDAQRRAAYARLDALLRERLADATRLPAHALTAAEIGARLQASGQPLDAPGLVAALEDCERARYGPAPLLPPPERFRSGLLAVERLLAGPRR